MKGKISIQIMAMATLGWLMVSCSQSSNEIEPTPDEPMAIGMATNLKSLSYTRAVYDNNEEVGNTTNLKSTGFAVHGWKNVAGTYTQVFNNTLVKGGTGSTTGWEYSPLRYWDKAAKEYDFVAYAPQVDNNADGTDDNVSATAPNPSASPSTNAKLTFTNIPQWQDITTDANKAAAKDYIVAQNKNTTANYLANSGIVHFDFYHLLARLNIKAYCRVNIVESNAKYILTGIKISSRERKKDDLTEDKSVGVPTSSRSCNYTADDVETGHTIVDNMDFENPTAWERNTNTDDVALFRKLSIDESPCIPSADPENPSLICNWLVAPFDVTDNEFGYEKSDNTDYFGPSLTLEVTYVIRTKTGTNATTGKDEYQFSDSYTSKVDLTYIDTEYDKEKPLLTGFKSHGDYTLTLNIEKGGVAVLLDVGILPWIPAETDADPRDVYNW